MVSSRVFEARALLGKLLSPVELVWNWNEIRNLVLVPGSLGGAGLLGGKRGQASTPLWCALYSESCKRAFQRSEPCECGQQGRLPWASDLPEHDLETVKSHVGKTCVLTLELWYWTVCILSVVYVDLSVLFSPACAFSPVAPVFAAVTLPTKLDGASPQAPLVWWLVHAAGEKKWKPSVWGELRKRFCFMGKHLNVRALIALSFFIFWQSFKTRSCDCIFTWLQEESIQMCFSACRIRSLGCSAFLLDPARWKQDLVLAFFSWGSSAGYLELLCLGLISDLKLFFTVIICSRCAGSTLSGPYWEQYWERFVSLWSQLPTFQGNNVVRVTYYRCVLLSCCEYTVPGTCTKGSLVCGLSYPILKVWKDFPSGKPSEKLYIML